jgi:hypothetical protein
MPIQFADLGKQTKDLLTKKYDYKTEFKAVTKSRENHVKIEAGGSGRTVQGYMKVFYKNKDFGKLEAEVHSNSEVGDKAKLKLNKLVDNVAVTLSASSLATVGLEATFHKDKVAANLELLHCEKSTNAGLSATATYQDVTVGASADIEAPNGNVVLKDYNAGLEFHHKDVTAAVKTANLRNEVTLSVFHKLDKRLNWGSSLVVRPNEGFSPILTLGVDYSLSPITSVKAKADSGGALAVAFEHRLKNPAFKFNVAAEYDCSKACGQPARQFGLSFVYGDY